MKKLIAYIILALLALPAFAQNERNNWYLGGTTHIRFFPKSAMIFDDSPSPFYYLASGVSDEKGNLLFRWDKTILYDGQGNVILNNAFPNLYSPTFTAVNPFIAIPDPASIHQYYLFYQCDSMIGTTRVGFNIKYYRINTQSYTLSQSFLSFLPTSSDNPFGGNGNSFVGFKSKNANEYWLITSMVFWNITEYATRLLSFRISVTGVNSTPAATDVPLFTATSGGITIHPCSGITAFRGRIPMNDSDMMTVFARLDETTGAFTNITRFTTDSCAALSGCFSASGEKYYTYLYMGATGSQKSMLSQIAINPSMLDSAQMRSSYQEIYSPSSGGSPRLAYVSDMELGPDGKIYMQRASVPSANYLARINNPEESGLACGFEINGLSLGTGSVGPTLPKVVTRYGNCGSFSDSVLPCGLMEFAIDTFVKHNAVDWEFGDSLNPSTAIGDTVQHQYSGNKVYTVRMAYENAGIYDTSYKNIQVNDLVSFAQLRDTAICLGDSIQVGYADTSIKNFQWSTGDNTDSIIIKQGGSYTVVLSNATCTAHDTFTVSSKPYPTINLGNDTAICHYDTLLLGRLQDTLIYTWSTGEDTSFIRMNDPGEYWVQVNNGTCSTSDTIMVSHHPLPTVSGLGEVSACFERGDTVTITSRISGNTYLWDNGSTGQSSTANTARTYYVQVTDQYGCIYQDSIIATNSCPAALYYPNAFTPNNDGYNDVFQVKGSGVVSYSLLIFNRWGEKVFESHDINTSWDGYYKGDICQDGVYWGVLKYQFAGRVAEDVKIVIHLIR